MLKLLQKVHYYLKSITSILTSDIITDEKVQKLFVAVCEALWASLPQRLIPKRPGDYLGYAYQLMSGLNKVSFCSYFIFFIILILFHLFCFFTLSIKGYFLTSEYIWFYVSIALHLFSYHKEDQDLYSCNVFFGGTLFVFHAT